MSAIKALSLWQPWASLIALGLKHYETRSWSTSYRGLLAIHAAKRPVKPSEVEGTDIEAALLRKGEHYDRLPLGAVLCIVRLTDVVPVEQVIALAATDYRVKNEELHYGNYAPGRYAWHMDLIRVAPEPVPARGAQGLWTWEY
jgi:hypothetical protein